MTGSPAVDIPAAPVPGAPPGAPAAPTVRDGSGAPGSWWRSSAGFVSIGGAVVLAVVAFAALFGVGHDDSAITFFKGDAWLPSNDSGSVVRVNGATGKPDFEMRFHGANGADLQVIQGPDGVFVLNRDTGEVTKLDDAQLQLGGTIKADPGDNPAFLIGGGKAFLVSQRTGRVQQVDPATATLDPVGAAVELRHPIANAVVDVGGRLAAAIRETGELAFVANGKAEPSVRVTDPNDDLRVSMVGDQLLAIDHTKGTVAPVDPATGVVSVFTIDVPRDGTLAFTEKMSGDRLWMLHVEQARLIGLDPSTGDQRKFTLDEVAGHEMGAPLANGAFVYVPDFQLGALLKIDATSGKILDRARVVDANDPSQDERNGRRFTAFVKDDRVWGNDPHGQVAVVIDRDGNAQQIEKYREGLPNNDDLAPLPDALPATTVPKLPKQTPPTTAPKQQDPGRGPTSTNPPDNPNDANDPTGPEPRDPRNDKSLPKPPVSFDPGGASQRSAGGDPGSPTDPSSTTTTTTAPGSTPPPPAATKPGAPLGVLSTAGDAMAKVTWTAASANGSPIIAYVVTDASRGVTMEVGGSVLEATLTGLTNDTTYTFSVHARNSIGDGPAASALPVTPAVQLPGAPSSFQSGYTYTATAAREDWIPRLTWAAPTVHPELVDHYEAVCAPPSVAAPPTIVPAGNGGPYTVDFPGLNPGTGYSCWARAVDAANRPGPRASMAPGSLVTPWGTPDVATNISTSIPPNSYACTITWTAGFNGGRPLFEYRVVAERYNTSTGAWEQVADNHIPVANGASTTVGYGFGDFRARISITNRDPATGDTTTSVTGYVNWYVQEVIH